MSPPVDEDVVAATGRLVAASSQNPGEDERAVAAVVEALCEELGLPAPRRVGLPERPNLVVELPFGAGVPRVALCGHLDTKPVGEGDWVTDPLQATRVDGELRGRGVVDMKGAIAAMLLAAADLCADPPDRGTLVLLFCADEENGATFGARWLSEHAPPRLDAMVIGEPGGVNDDWDRLHLGSRGICNFDIDVTTTQGHSGLTDLFGLVSATEVAARLVVALRDDFEPPFPPDRPGQPTMNAGVVLQGGINYGVVPGWAHVASDCRLVAGMDRDTFAAAVRAFVESRLPAGAEATVTVRDWIPAVTADSSETIADAARKALADTIGSVPPDDIFPATTDATWFAALGVPTLPALGPGLLRHAHAPNEAVSVTALGQARALYRCLVHHYCGAGR
jgi:acetylornithine deacetylase/succinyl-diaminopimelate desuccinylase-like protein